VHGTIRSTLWRGAVPVWLEIAPWSPTRTTVAVRVRGWRRCSGAGLYRRVGPPALDVLIAELDRWALHDLHDLAKELAVRFAPCSSNGSGRTRDRG